MSMAELIFKKAGNIELIRYKDSKRFLKNGVVQSLAPQITNNTTTLANGNDAMDDVFSAGKSAQVTVTLNSFQPKLYAALVAADFTEGQSFNIRKIEEATIPSASPYTVILQRTPVSGTIVVHDENDSPLTLVSTTPSVGQFSVSASNITFCSVDADKQVIIAYDVSANSKRVQLSSNANNDTFRMIISGEARLHKDEGTAKIDAVVFDRVMPTGDIPFPSRQKEPQSWNFTMQVLRPRPGYQVVEYIVEE